MSKRTLTRRKFLATAVTAAAGATLAACAPQTLAPTAAPPTSAPPVPTQAPPPPTVAQALKTLRYAMSGKITSADTADPAFNNTSHDGRLISAVYEQLARYDESLKATPWLAESWEPNDKGDVWTFKLRQGVTWHDGTKFTSKDVLYSFRRLLDPATKSPGAGPLSFIDLNGIEAMDDYTVRFKLPTPNVDVPLSMIVRQAYIVKDGSTAADLKTKANGTGAYMLKQFVPGEDPTIFVKNPNYWQPGLPKLDVLELTSIPEAPSRVAALQRGQIDIIEDPPFTELDKLKGGADTTIVVQPKGNMDLIAMQIDVPPFDDLRVRQAIKYAMDRDAVLKLVAQGYGTPVNDIPIASTLEYGLQGPPLAHDVEKAKALLKEAGYSNGLDIKLAVSDVQARFVEFATVFKEQVAEAGIRVELDIRPADTYWDVVWLKAPMFVSAYIARATDAMLAPLYLSKADWNETHWKDPAWDKMLTDARATLDYDKRKALYQQLQQQIVDDGGHIVPYMVQTIDATRKNVTCWLPSGTPYANFTNLDIG